MKTIETMTLEQLDKTLREDFGLQTSKARLADGIEQGVYPFAVCIRSTEHRRLFEIYTRKFYEWVNEVCVESGTP